MWMFPAALVILGATAVSSQPYPNKPVRVVTAEVGGAADIALRIITPALSGSLGQPVIVENRISGVIPADTVAKAQPDGYTLLLYSNGVWILPLMQKAPYDPVRDYAPLTLTMRSPSFLVAHPTLAVNSVRELIALAKARPGQLNYGSGGTGGAGHLAAELFKAMANVDIVRIPYKGGGPALNDLLGGQIQLGFLSSASVSPHMKTGKLKTLASTGAQPFALFPEVPTIAASGLPGYESEQLLGMFAPAKTPVAIVNRLNQEIVQTLNRAEVRERLSNIGVETGGNTPAQFAAMIKSEIARMGKVIRDAGIRAD
jgi:tripartite-type tricarboxylate transporter receptor subunit TctC